jgi:outer membrane protein assembly factor BamB
MTSKLRKKLLIFILVLISAGAWYYMSFIKNDSWELALQNTATSSSCHAVELTGDDVMDIVIGAGSIEHEATKNGVLAINGHTGKLIWNVPCRDQVVGTAIFMDVTGDGIKDVFIGGRKNQLWCINGANGTIIWEHMKSLEGFDPKDKRILNFFNPQFIADQDNDNFQDIIISFGGYVHAKAGDNDRPPGSIMILSSKTGKILSKSDMPDGKETYFSPVVYDFKNDKDPFVIFGSGGETISGNLYIIRLSSLLTGNIASAKKLADGIYNGFISPPILIDITKDDVKDIVVNSFDGRMMAFDGKTFDLLWSIKLGYKIATFSALAPVEMNGDGIMDFFGSYGEGIWNDYRGTVQVVVDGKTGKELIRYHIGTFQYASPLVADFTKDGNDDVLLHTNSTVLSKTQKDDQGASIPIYSNKLTVFDLHNNKIFNLGNTFEGSNLLSTPLLIDLDSDGTLDILHTRQANKNDIYSSEKLIITRKEINLKLEKPLTWGAYLGSNFDCIN